MSIVAIFVVLWLPSLFVAVMSAPLKDCTFSTCLNGGVCLNSTNGSYCSCTAGYRGRYCATRDIEALKNEVDALSEKLSRLQNLQNQFYSFLNQVFTDTMDSILSSQGPRFFTEWMTIEHREASQLRMFSIGNNRLFVGVATTTHNHALYGITIYEIISNSSLNTIQTIQVEAVRAFQTFSIGGGNYIAIACHHGNRSNSSSWLYKWSESQFVLHQEIKESQATDVDFISTSSGSFLAFGSDHSDVIRFFYVWDPASEQFVSFLPIPETNATKVHFLSTTEGTYLTLAGTDARSAVFEFKGSNFEPFRIEANIEAQDLYPFPVGPFLFLAASNQFGNRRQSHSLVLYRLSGDGFEEHASLPVTGHHVRYFPVKGEHFLAVAGAQSSSDSSNLVVYKLDGASVVEFQKIPAPSTTFVDTYQLPNGCRILLVSNKSGFPKLYKWVSVGLKQN